MKLRIKGDSIRFRLTRPEVDAIGRGQAVIEKTRLPSPFSYTLAVGGDAIGADYAHGCVTVTLPREIASRWANTDEVSLHAHEGAVAILVEKDFECLEPREGEADPDAFPNPTAKTKD